MRKTGNKLIFSIAQSLGEGGFDQDPYLLKTVMNICQDNNYKIRRDGVIFFKGYLQTNKT